MAPAWNFRSAFISLEPEVRARLGEYAAGVLAARGIRDPHAITAFLKPQPCPPLDTINWPQLDAATERIVTAIAENKKLLLTCDRRFESLVAAALLLDALTAAGADSHFVRDPQQFVNQEHIASQSGPTALEIRIGGVADTISGAIVLEACLGPLADADANLLLNPLQLEASVLWRHLPEVGLAWLLAASVLTRLGRSQAIASQWVDLVLAGCVAGLASLEHCRNFVLAGLAQPGSVRRSPLDNLIERYRGQLFKIAFPLDALSYLDDPAEAVQWLLGEPSVACCEAFERHRLEHQRQIEAVLQQATALIEQLDPAGRRELVLSHPRWPYPVLRLAAARLAGRYRCPVVLITCPEESSLACGYGYAQDVDLIAVFETLAPLLVRAGGQPGSVRFSCKKEHLASLCRALTQQLQRCTAPDRDHNSAAIVLDAETILDLPAELDRLFREVERLAPFGPGQPRPLVALRNFRPQWSLSRDGRHLDCKLGARTLRWPDGGDQRHRWQQEHLVDLVFELEPWEATLWWGWIHHLQPAEQRTTIEEETSSRRSVQIEDFRRLEASFSESLPALVLRRWPCSAAELASQLQQSPWPTVVLAGRSDDWSRSRGWIVELSRRWQAGMRDREALELAGLPGPLLERILDWAAAGGDLVQGATAILQEARAFQHWLDTAPAAEIGSLCDRLLSGDD
ncbi:single-stranded-DNA-specific exonuclease RecJ [Gloeobacter kilaueensis]|uniref:Single-stranded-DNA-specific exonuclease RecJ n=1 Tax=Gloeobacter kilaueensis (strain ATCC BAA-2537 / CCAP 1431/1 / ULC 316 / JS1) TaxID=1183438 RepID=U5QMH3_GLOK1|nr:single-stranded-DNA-specific exonuclease RecJ [Gloeobacter kilaueensis]AGY58840.1 single-stranded-DNA-specific exonuclease RecJ [Gloeobacter kilaueensis JS1]